MAKKWICLILAAVLAFSLCACGDKGDDQPTTYDPADHKQVAEKFLEAYFFRDYATRFSLMFYNYRQQWEDNAIKDTGSAEAFFATAQQQADNKGIEADIHSFDDYYAAYYQFIQADCRAMYGDYTFTIEATESTQMDAATFATFCDGLLGNIDEKYIDGAALRAVTEAHSVKVHLQIDGTLKDHSETYLIHLVRHDGRWLVASHSI